MRSMILPVVAVLVLLPRGEPALAQTRDNSAQVLVRWTPAGTPTDGAVGRRDVDPNVLLTLQVQRTEGSWARRGAVLGAVVGGVAGYVVLHRGGSTSLCDRSANQDAMGRRECVGLTVAGAVAGAGLGAWIGSRWARR